jgi:ferredoxin-NADP reductase
LEKKEHTGSDVMSFRFSRTGKDNQYLDYKAGQYCIVDLGTKEDPEGPIRSFTMASAPTEKDSILITTRIRDTLFKKKLESLEIESTSVNISAPLGRFVLHDDYSKPAVFLSGGIGVTPFRSMVKYASDAKLPLKITMFDANRNLDNTIFKDEFDSLAKINPNLRIIYTISDTAYSGDWNGERGYITKVMVSKYLDSNQLKNAIFYICGPPAMLDAMKKLLVDELEIPEEQIKVEEFLGY